MLPILMYHEINGRDKYSVSVREFEEQMRYLSDRGFATVGPGQEAAVRPGSRGVMITFDDGYRTDLTIARPLLARFGFSAASFVTTAYVGRERYLSWEEVRALADGNFAVHSHTHTHPFLNDLGEDEVRQELATSKRLLEERLGSPVTALALPGGGFPREIVRIALAEGYRFVYSSRPGINDVPGAVGERVLITRNTSLEDFKKIVHGDPAYYARALRSYRARAFIKSIVGNRRYHRLWSRYYKQGGTGDRNAPVR